MNATLKAGRAVPRANDNVDRAPVLPDGHATNDYQSIASRLVDAYADTDATVKAIETEAARSISVAKSSLLDKIEAVASSLPGLTVEQWDAHLKAPIEAGFKSAGYSAIPTRVAMLKVAFLAFANGVKPQSDKAKANIQHFVNDEARPALREKNVLEQKAENGGRPKGATSDKVTDERHLAALLLSGTPELDAEKVKLRAKKLLACCTAGHWQALEKALDQILGA